MAFKKLHQFKQLQNREKMIDAQVNQVIIARTQASFFNKHVPAWLRWLMARNGWLRNKLDYQIGIIDGNLGKLILYRTVRGKTKLIAKSY